MPSIRRIAYGTYAISAFVMTALPTWLLVAVVPGLARRRRIAHHGARAFFRLAGLRLSVDRFDRLPDEPCFVVANHASYVDGVLLTAVLPPRFAFVIKDDMGKVPMAGYFLRRIGSQFVDRTNTRRSALDARRIMRAASQETSIGIFPEGTFRREPGVGRFRPGAFRVAARHGLKIVPVTITGTRQLLPDGAWLPRLTRIRLFVAEPLQGDDAEDLRELSRARILASVGEPDLDAR
ncbi:MAG: lysophospholipid acyltransferase family protein [Pseudomonadota bacterium]